MADLFIYIIIFLCSLFFTEQIRRYSLKKNLLDTPNSRSSHSVATPSGGGLAIVIFFLAAISISDSISNEITFVLVGAGSLVALVGLLDDQSHIAARWRLLSHFSAAIWVLYWMGGIPEFQFLDVTINLEWGGFVIVAFALVWMLNLFNFMDGIDGIAASEVIFVSSAGAYFSWLNGLESLSYISLVLAASSMGFLILNWPPAKIFMGDVGSGFLGFMLGIIIYADVLEGGSIWIWLVLLSIFLVDSGVTLLRRILSGEKWYEAHCSHSYQHAARKWGHKRVTVTIIMINICWLFPLAYLVYLNKNIAVLLTMIAYVPLFILALMLKAGMVVNK